MSASPVTGGYRLGNSSLNIDRSIWIRGLAAVRAVIPEMRNQLYTKEVIRRSCEEKTPTEIVQGSPISAVRASSSVPPFPRAMSRFKLNMPARGGYYAADHKKHGQKGTGGWRTMDKTRRNKMIASYLADWVLTIFLWSVDRFSASFAS